MGSHGQSLQVAVRLLRFRLPGAQRVARFAWSDDRAVDARLNLDGLISWTETAADEIRIVVGSDGRWYYTGTRHGTGASYNGGAAFFRIK